jgi:hypothetical protein
MGWCSEPKAPDNNPGLIASAQMNQEIAREQLAMGREQFEWAKQNAVTDREMLEPILQQQMRIADTQEARSAEQYDYWSQKYKPLEEKIVDEALTFNEKAEQEKMAGRAGADVEQAFDAARGQTRRELGRYGINPASSSALRAAGTLGDEEALAKAGAMNNSRLQSKAMGMAMMADAANMGRNLAGQSNSAAALALQAGGAGQGNIMGQTQNAVASRGLGNQNFSNAIGANTSAGNLYNSDFNTRVQSYGTQSAAYGDKMGAVSSIAGGILGKFADGGQPGDDLPSVAMRRSGGVVRGPGTGISDSIPAKLSDGEFVIPADVVKRKGLDFFEGMIKKYHEPAAQQRARGV